MSPIQNAPIFFIVGKHICCTYTHVCYEQHGQYSYNFSHLKLRYKTIFSRDKQGRVDVFTIFHDLYVHMIRYFRIPTLEGLICSNNLPSFY